MEISSPRRLPIAARTNTACPVANATSPCKMSRWNLLSERVANPPLNSFTHNGPRLLSHGNSVHNLQSPRHRSLERKDRDLAFSRIGSDALWRAFLSLHFSADRLTAGDVAARLAQCPRRHDEHRDPDHVVGDSRSGVCIAEDAKV